MDIRQLPPEVVAQIAAGEVVTRAGDVVKELVENAIDAILARASRFSENVPAGGLGLVSVDILEGGYARIEVGDDGCGVQPRDLPVAFLRHATSKISSAQDLYGLKSLGFRGEALAAIAAAADVDVVSATSDGGAGAAISVVDGRVGPVAPRARRGGTTVTVQRLFERLPVRRRYQRAPSAETAYIGGLLQGFAFAYPEIAFSLDANGRRVFRTDGSGDLREVAVALLGPETAAALLLIHDDRDPGDDTYGFVAITGLVGSPSVHRATRNGILLTVNRRPVESRALTYAVEEAYATQIPVGRHPLAVVDLTVPVEDVDANVHPTKREVRLVRDRLAFSVVQRAVRATLGEPGGIPQFGQIGSSGYPQFGQMDSSPPLALSPVQGSAPLPFEPPEARQMEVVARPELGRLRILGQVGLTYIICEGGEGLYLVDQHAAHERVLLERLERRFGTMDRAQLLMDPIAVELPGALRASLDDYVGALEALGFAAEPIGNDAVVIRAVPAALRARDLDRVLRETHEALAEEGVGPDWRERLAILLSCKTAVKAGQRMEIAEMQALLGQLDETNLCATCSHGRPTAILLSHSQLEREFGRR